MINDMYGVVDSVFYCSMERTQELNDRIASRNIPSATLEPQFSMRPASTKYSLFPMVDRHEKSNVPIQAQPTFNLEKTFNPGNDQAPWSGFSSKINDESKLRNQLFALQNCEQANYIPASSSELYNANPGIGRQEEQPFPGLFETQQFESFNPNSCNVGSDLFDNCTRQQLNSNN